MLHQAIRLGCEIFHKGNHGPRYTDALKGRKKWRTQLEPSLEEVMALRRFANGWSSRMTASAPDILYALSEILPCLDQLRCQNVLDMDFNDKAGSEKIGYLIARCFDKLARCNPRNNNEATGASKIMHIVYPKFFVMWDGAIRGGYGFGGEYEGVQYVDFLRRMQRVANYAINQVEEECDVSREDAIESLKCDGHTLAKALDEYNYVKFTLNDDAVWQAEYEPCNSP